MSANQVASLAALATLWIAPVHAGEAPRFGAREGLALTRAAAKAWADDAALVYLENDEDLSSEGTAPRWGYLYYSPGKDRLRVYSVRAGEIVTAEDPGIQVWAPPLPAEWIDSREALVAAEREAGAKFCAEMNAHAQYAILMRGAFGEKDPGRATWVVVYQAASAPGLFVVVDAVGGSVLRTWRG